jgi:phenylalanyl-tRNA synthetase beta chain
MLEYGQPMHAFDLRYLDGGKVIVRNAAEGEKITTLDDIERNLTPEMLVIADENKPVAVAGVMGGEYSGIMDDTTTIVFESACFNGVSVRRTSKALGLRTEACTRYEKELNPASCETCLKRALQLVELLDAGDVVDGIVDCFPTPKEPVKLAFEPEWVNNFIGIDVSADEQKKMLEKIGFTVEDGVITAPYFRNDIEHKADISEEIARFYGYDNIKPVLFKTDIGGGGYTDEQKFENALNVCMRSCGLSEAVTYTFISPKAYDKLRVDADSPLRDCLKIKNPIGEDTSVMRTTVLPSILEVLGRNYSFKNPEAYIYEIGKVFIKTEDVLPEERKILSAGIYDMSGDCDFFTLKGIVEKIMADMNIKEARYLPCTDNPSYHPGRTAEIQVEGQIIGVFGQIHPLVAEAYGIDRPVFCMEISLPALYEKRAPEKKFKPIPKHPASVRDLALICGKEVYSADIIATVKAAAGEILEDVKLFDVYTGAQIGEGNKSLAYTLTFRKAEGTLSDGEVEAVVGKILSALEKEGVKLRS